jgi:signal transduction histidine kinase
VPARVIEELSHERVLAQRATLVRLVLTLANFAIIALDHTVPFRATAAEYLSAYAAALAFLIYAVAAWLSVQRQWIPLDRVLVISPTLDVVFASILILATDGYLSPFHLWFVVAVVGSSFSRYGRLPLATAALALVAHCLITLVPQAQPLDVAVFAVRTGFLFGVAAVLSAIGVCLASQSRFLAVIEDVGRQLGETMTQYEAARLLAQSVTRALRLEGACAQLVDGTTAPDGATSDAACETRILAIGSRTFGTLFMYRRSRLSRREQALARVLCDRTASALLRIRLTHELVHAATATERVRLSDELHDSCLQNLAALDLRAEAALQLGGHAVPDLADDLRAIKQLSRQAAEQVRECIAAPVAPSNGDAAALRRIIAERWSGPADVQIAPDVALSGGQWSAIASLVREGLNNIRKHARASRVRFDLDRSPDGGVVCRLENDGDPLVPPAVLGYGLSRLRCLVEEQGGRLQLLPNESGGARLVAEFGGCPCAPSVP